MLAEARGRIKECLASTDVHFAVCMTALIGRLLQQQSVYLLGKRGRQIFPVGKLNPDEVELPADVVNQRMVGVGVRRNQERFPALNRVFDCRYKLWRDQLHRGDLVDDDEGDCRIGHGVQDCRDADRIEIGNAHVVASDLTANGLMYVSQDAGATRGHIGDREANPVTTFADLGRHHPSYTGTERRDHIQDQRCLAHARAACENDAVVVHVMFPFYPLEEAPVGGPAIPRMCEVIERPSWWIVERLRLPLSSDFGGTVEPETNCVPRIAHLDMDAFFAAVEQRDDRTLRGRPVIVGGLGGRGVVATASYEARAFGIHSAMSTQHARRLCPQGIFLRPEFDKYRRVSNQVMAILRSVSTSIEPISLDEAFFDLTASAATLDDAARIAVLVKQRVWQETRLSCSVGVAPNRFLAKLGSELDKPDGLRVIHPGEVDGLLAPLGVGQLWGVGTVTERRLFSMGVMTVADLRSVPEALLNREFGQMGRVLYRLARGQDSTPIRSQRDSRSISREITYSLDVRDPVEMAGSLREMANEVGAQLVAQHLAARTARIKVRFPDFRTETRQLRLTVPTSSPHLIGEVAVHLLHTRTQAERYGVRLLGVGVSRLSATSIRQLSLFDDLDNGVSTTAALCSSDTSTSGLSSCPGVPSMKCSVKRQGC